MADSDCDVCRSIGNGDAEEIGQTGIFRMPGRQRTITYYFPREHVRFTSIANPLLVMTFDKAMTDGMVQDADFDVRINNGRNPATRAVEHLVVNLFVEA